MSLHSIVVGLRFGTDKKREKWGATAPVVAAARPPLTAAQPPTPQQRRRNPKQKQGWSGPLKAAVTSGSLCAVGDVLAQSIGGWYASREAGGGSEQQQSGGGGKKKKGGGAPASPPGSAASSYQACRTLRMAGFGFFFYGPYQYYWYSLLEHLMPARTVPNFVSKVAANQLLLAPVTLTVAFAWHLAFSPPPAAAQAGSAAAAAAAKKGAKKARENGLAAAGSGASSSPAQASRRPAGLAEALADRLAPLPDKMRRDFFPAMITGWKFWIPAASVNFCAVPLRHQVLYMSLCGVLWTAYLSHASGTKIGADKARAAPAPAKRR